MKKDTNHWFKKLFFAILSGAITYFLLPYFITFGIPLAVGIWVWEEMSDY
jgi:hypothetical protein